MRPVVVDQQELAVIRFAEGDQMQRRPRQLGVPGDRSPAGSQRPDDAGLIVAVNVRTGEPRQARCRDRRSRR